MIVGLGNPGATYARNRHNIGHQCIDRFAARHQIELDRTQHRARIGTGWVQRRQPPGAVPSLVRQKVILVKPLTFMNESGAAVNRIAQFYQIAVEDILVIHDHLDLEAGVLRLRPDGGSGGNNGVKSVIQHLGSEAFPRIRVGIGRPPGRMDPAAYVLQDFSRQEEETIFDPLRETVCDAVEMWLFQTMDATMNQFNG